VRSTALRNTWLSRILPAAGVAVLLPGCGFDLGYVISAAAGQFSLLRDSVSISEAVESGQFSEEELTKLQLIQDARAYARDAIGLNVGDHFTLFYDSEGQPVAFNISASQKDAFVPETWWFPIVGTVPYLGFFELAEAEAAENELAARGLDVWMYEIDAYSLLDFFPTILLSPMLERSEINLADVVFHELLHSTVWRAGDTTFNESLATFVGRQGAIDFLSDRHPDDPELVQAAVEHFEDSDRFSEFMLSLFNDLDAYYASDLSSEARIAGREAVYQAGRDRFAVEVQPLMNDPDRYDWVQNVPTNNAYMLGVRRYNLDLAVFEQVFAATGGDWPASLELFGAAADHSSPYEFLQDWLDSAGTNTRHPAGLKVGDRAGSNRSPVRVIARPLRCPSDPSTPRS